MKNELAALREAIVTETVSIYPDFHFFLGPDKNDNLTAECRGTWEANPTPDADDVPFLTIQHDGDRFFVSHYLWSDRRKYKTFKGAAKYVNEELQKNCNRRREQKAKSDAEREHKRKSVEVLQSFHSVLSQTGIESRLCLTADRHNFDHISIDAKRINNGVDVTVTDDYRLKISLTFPRIYAAPETALEILSVFSKKGTA